MITATIEDIWLGRIKVRGQELYLFRDRETVFYIGRSTCPSFRLREHMNPAQRSKVGALIREHLPESLSWLITFFDVGDCEKVVAQYLPHEYERFQAYCGDENYCSVSLVIAERALITSYHPCFNVQWNPHPTPLPEKYRSVRSTTREQQPESKRSIKQWIRECACKL